MPRTDASSTGSPRYPRWRMGAPCSSSCPHTTARSSPAATSSAPSSTLCREPAEDRVTEIGPDGDAPQPPRVSVVVTLYNYAHTIGDAIRSVGLSDLDAVEIVLVDDASTDDSLDVARATLDELPWLRGRIVERGANGGLARARNLGVEYARAEYVFILDADNTVHRAGLRHLAVALGALPDAHLAYGLIRTVSPT